MSVLQKCLIEVSVKRESAVYRQKIDWLIDLLLLRYSKMTKQKRNTLTFATIWFSVASLSKKPKIENEINVVTFPRETVFGTGYLRV